MQDKTRTDYIVYKHTNKINGKVYIGQTYNLYERWRCQGKNYFSSIKFFNAIKKYGWNNFIHEVLYTNLNKEAADKLEKELIVKYNSIKNGYNLKEGGSRGNLSQESLLKMSKSLKRGYLEHPERREKIGQKLRGRKGTKEESRKKSLSNRKSVLITLNEEIGSIRFWCLKLGVSRYTAKEIYRNLGIGPLILWFSCALKGSFLSYKDFKRTLLGRE